MSFLEAIVMVEQCSTVTEANQRIDFVLTHIVISDEELLSLMEFIIGFMSSLLDECGNRNPHLLSLGKLTWVS